MKKEEGKNQPHLLMLAEFDGEIDGELKYNKVLYKYRHNTSTPEDWAFDREQWGPTDPGFTSVMQSLDDLDLTEEELDEIHVFKITSKGKDVADGVKRGLSKLDPGFTNRLGTILGIAEKDKDRSGSQIEEDEVVQDAKEEAEQFKV